MGQQTGIIDLNMTSTNSALPTALGTQTNLHNPQIFAVYLKASEGPGGRSHMITYSFHLVQNASRPGFPTPSP